MKRFSFIAALLLCFVTAASAAIRPAQPGIGGGGGTVSGSITGAYSFSSGFTTVNATNVSMLPAISNLAINVAYTNAAMIFSNVLTLNPTSTTPRLNGMHLTNQAALARVGDTIRVSPGTYWSPTNVFSVLRNGVNWDVAEGATLIFGTTGDESDYNIPFNDWSGAVTSYISGAGTFIVSNNLANLLNLTNSASRVIWFGKEIRAANDQAAVMQGHPNDTVGGGSKLWLYLSDGLYSDGYDAYINQHNPNSAQTFIYASRLYGDNDDSGDSAFETTVGYANPGDCVVRVGAARGSVTLAQNMDLELGVLDLGAFNMVYSPTNDSGNGVLRNTYIYGTSNRTTSLIYSTDGRFGTAGTYVQCTLVGSTNRPIALITNDAVGKITFISSRFLDGFGATNSIRSVNAQRVTLVATDTPLGLHANVTAAVATNQAEARFRQLATFETGIDVSSDLNANGQLNAGDFTTTGTTIIGGPLEIPTGASSGYVLTSDGSGVATWAAPTGGSGGGGTNFPNVNLLLGGTNLTLSAGVRKAYHNQTNGSHGINLNLAVPESGYEVVYSVSNSGSSDITVTFYTNSVAANPYYIGTKTNVNTFTAAASAITKVKLTYAANGLWLLDRVDGPASILKFGSGITATTNGVNNLDVTISASGGGGSSSFNITNVTVSDTNEIVLDVAAFDIAKITLLTNLNLLTFSNVSTMGKRSHVYFQQDTNGVRLISQNRVAGGLLQTNANLQPTTNANALDLLEIMPGFFTSNAIAWWPQNFQPRVAFTNSLAGSGAECATTDTALAHDVLLEGWQGDGTENAWTEAGTPGMITMGADSSALTSGKPDGACDLAMSFENVGFGTENWVRWDNGSAIDVDTVAVDIVFYIYVETRLDSGESFNIVSANPTTTFSSTLGASIALGDNGTAATLTARGNTAATAGALTSGQWNLVKLHIDTATTGNASYLQINGGSTLGFNRSTGGEDVQYFNFGAGSSLDAGDVCKFWIDVVAINTP